MVDSTVSNTFSSVDALLAVCPKGQTSGEKEEMSTLHTLLTDSPAC